VQFGGFPSAAASKNAPQIVSVGPDRKLTYSPDPQGNRIPDFSHCGYAGGDRPIPEAPVQLVVAPKEGDSTARIQSAIDYIATLAPDSNGLRGAVLLLKGRHSINGQLRINASGIVLRGQGMDENGTILVASGFDRRTLIRIAGSPASPLEERAGQREHASFSISDDYVPVGAASFHVESGSRFKLGDTVLITRPSTQPWIDRLGMNEFGGGIGDWRLVWKPGTRDLIWDRLVKSVDGNLITIDAPITTAIEKQFGGGHVETYSWPGRISNVGVESLRCESDFDSANPKDENHSWMAITMENIQNAWVRQVAGTHFAGSLVAIYESCKWVTVQDCLSLAPVSEDGGYRRHTFFTIGQMTLFLRCWAEHGRHDFSVGHCAAGPNAFVQCEATEALGDSGPIESWAAGVLYDNVVIDRDGLSLFNRGAAPNGAGWSAANSVLWQCSAATIRCFNPPTACNWAFGSWAEFDGDGIWRKSNEFVKPGSLYASQVSDRLGQEAAARIKLLSRSTDESSNPSVPEAAQLIAASTKPAPQLKEFILAARTREPIPAVPGDAPSSEQLNPRGVSGVGDRGSKIERSGSSIQDTASGTTPNLPHSTTPLVLTNGWVTLDGRLAVGSVQQVSWWRGNIRPSETSSGGPCLTRFVPGRTGQGFTDDLDELADSMLSSGKVALDHHYGLWYERRRDDHERVRRPNGDVWPPFYEQPFARSGKGTAWDGLSKYDLTRYNPWYWSRLQEFATVCDNRGLILFHENFFQHNILEAGAHWADCPWRSANNLNNTDFPEPPPYAGDKRIFMAEQFYDFTHPVRRELLRAYIRQCLDAFATNSNVIQFTSAEYTGPLQFTQFWIDTIAEWEKEKGHRKLIALSCTRDVQDAILDDSQRQAVVDVIDFRYWWQTDKGLFAPKGGQNLAPRQFERQWKGGKPNDRNLAEMAAEYRGRFPTKPLICDFDQAGWAYLCAGGSLPRLPRSTNPKLLGAIPRMTPWIASSKPGHRVLREGGRQYLVCTEPNDPAKLDLSAESGDFVGHRIDPRTGALESLPGRITGGAEATLPKSDHGISVLWLTRP
jgi:hypothetical protein